MAERAVHTQVLVAGGGPVGLAAAIELGRREIETLVVEPRTTVSRARPRCKTINVRTMEHIHRWGIEERLRAAAPLSPEWSTDLVFCTAMNGYELSRFTDVFGLTPQGDRFATVGQQAPQFILEEVLREVVGELPQCRLELGSRVSGLTQGAQAVDVMVQDESGERTVSAEYVIGADGPSSAVREAIGARYVGGAAMRPNFACIFRAPEMWDRMSFGRAVQYWIINPFAPGVMGPVDGGELWWAGFLGVDRDRGERDVTRLLQFAIGTELPVEVLSTDPWTAKMQLADTIRKGRVVLAGDAAHLNPPWGGHGLNTGIGDAVDLGWKLAAVLDGWGGATLLESYVSERRPVHAAVIAEAEANMNVLPAELANPEIAVNSSAGEVARRRADAKIQETKDSEFHALDLVLGVWSRYESSPVVVSDGRAGSPSFDGAHPGWRLPHVRLASGASIFDELGANLTLLALRDGQAAPLEVFAAVCRKRGVPVRTVDLGDEPGLEERFGVGLVLVRPDQHVAWCGNELPPSVENTIDVVRGVARERHTA